VTWQARRANWLTVSREYVITELERQQRENERLRRERERAEQERSRTSAATMSNADSRPSRTPVGPTIQQRRVDVSAVFTTLLRARTPIAALAPSPQVQESRLVKGRTNPRLQRLV
jgi:hypothetical protein